MLENRVSLITGGTRGIGKAIALKLAKMGSNLVINYLTLDENTQKEIDEMKDNVKEYRTKILFVPGDVSNFEDAKTMIDSAMNEFGRIDILVNNAGITKDRLMLKMTEKDFDSVIAVNLKGAFNMIKHITPVMMKQREGSIISISSIVGVNGNAGQANYSASKAGIIGLTKSMAKELAGRNVRVNAVAPGFIRTAMTDVLTDDVKANILSQIPMKRMGTAEEIADLVGFLASDDSKYITGQVININGGML